MVKQLIQAADMSRRAARHGLFEIARACDRIAGRLEGKPLLPAAERLRNSLNFLNGASSALRVHYQEVNSDC